MIAAHLLSPPASLAGWLIYLPLLCWAIWRARLGSSCAVICVASICSVARRWRLFVLWLVRRDFDSGLSYHLSA